MWRHWAHIPQRPEIPLTSVEFPNERRNAASLLPIPAHCDERYPVLFKESGIGLFLIDTVITKTDFNIVLEAVKNVVLNCTLNVMPQAARIDDCLTDWKRCKINIYLFILRNLQEVANFKINIYSKKKNLHYDNVQIWLTTLKKKKKCSE